MTAIADRPMDLHERGAGVARHPWETARADFFRQLIASHIDVGTVSRVLDAGAGDGWFAEELLADVTTTTSITCWDVNYRSEELDTPTDPRIARTNTFPSGRYDLVLALDVLEHIDDAESFLAESLVPVMDGPLVVSVPAHPGLFSAHDRMLEHRRRYRRRDLLTMLSRHVEVVESGGLFTSLLLPRAVSVAAERLGRTATPKGVGSWTAGPHVSRLCASGLAVDSRLGRRLARYGVVLPGLSVWAVGRRRDS